MSNPYFQIGVGQTTPTLDAALFDTNGNLVNLVGCSVTFSLFSLGGTLIFTRAGTIVAPAQGHVRYSWQAGDTNTANRYLGKFTVTYANMSTQEFPENRYIRVTVS
jgi:hypothetical protein